MARIIFAIVTVALLSGNPSWAGMPEGAVYEDGGNSEYALILCHGVGQSPTAQVVGPLRLAVHEELGWHTLSLAMPRERNWREFGRVFPQAYARIAEAIEFLRREKGVREIYLLGHSMGGRMSSAFLAHHPDQPVRGLIVAGVRHDGGPLMNAREHLERVSQPVLDIWGEDGGLDGRFARERSDLVSRTYVQVPVAGANHAFERHEETLSRQVIAWLRAQGVQHVADPVLSGDPGQM